MKEIIVLQHINIEDPGYIKDLMIKDNINLTTIELDEGERNVLYGRTHGYLDGKGLSLVN